jgi:hypothetical protein
MAQFRYPGNLSEKHPVQTRISILKRFNALGVVNESGGSLQVFKGGAKAVQEVKEGGGVTNSPEIIDKISEEGRNLITKQLVDTSEGTLATIYLYAPSSIQFADGLAYDNQEMGVMAAAFFDAADAATAQNREMTTLESFANVTGGVIAGAVTEVGKRSGFSQQARLRAGVARNPRTEMLFRSPTMRQLSLSWKLMPTNDQESETIFAMINKMRQHAYPSIGTTGKKMNMAFPDIFQVDFVNKSGGKAKMIQFAKAYCTAINTTYGSSGPAFFKGGKPVEIDLTMTFQEAEIQTRESLMALDGGGPSGGPASASAGSSGIIGDGFGGGD